MLFTIVLASHNIVRWIILVLGGHRPFPRLSRLAG